MFSFRNNISKRSLTPQRALAPQRARNWLPGPIWDRCGFRFEFPQPCRFKNLVVWNEPCILFHRIITFRGAGKFRYKKNHSYGRSMHSVSTACSPVHLLPPTGRIKFGPRSVWTGGHVAHVNRWTGDQIDGQG